MEYKSNILENLQPDYIQLSSNVYADKLTGNVSIGEVQGATFTDKFMVKATAGNGVNQIVLQHSGNGVAIAGIGQESSHGSLQLRLNSGATQVRLSAINSNYIIPSLGIGTTSPSAKLHVKEALGSTSQIKMSAESNEANYGYLTMLDNTVNTAKLTLGTTWGYNTPIDAMTIVNGTVGIGTTSPESKLHVFAGESNGGAANSQSTLTLENNDHTYLQFLTPANRESGILFGDNDNDRGALTYSHSTDSMNFRVAASTKMFITSAGDVGIGTTNPDSKLDVKGPSAAPADGGQTLSITNITGGTQLNLGTAENAYGWIEAREGGTLRNLLLNPNGGNVGVGLLNPDKTLDVFGTGRFYQELQLESDLSGHNKQTGVASSPQPRIKRTVLESSIETSNAVVHPYFNNDLGNFVARGGTVTFGGLTATPSSEAQNQMFQPSNQFMGLNSADISGSTWSITLLSSSDAAFNLSYGCYIGITFGSGAFDPTSILIEGTTDATGASGWITALNSSAESTTYSTYLSSGGAGIKALRFTMGYTSGSPRVVSIFAYNFASKGMKNFFLGKDGGKVYGDIQTTSYGSSNPVNNISNNGSSFFNGGNVGIGMTNPSQKLQVDGNAYIGTGAADDNLALRVYGNNAGVSKYLELAHTNASSSRVKTNNSYLSLESAGYILLSNSGLFYGDTLILNNKRIKYGESNGSWRDVMYLGTDNVFRIGTISTMSSGGDTAMYHSGSEKVRITSSGVGIGTTSPASKLHVDGNIRWEGISGVEGVLSGSEVDLTISSIGSSPIVMDAAGTNALRLDPDEYMYKIGDYDGDNNGTYLEIDDDGQLSTFYNSDLDVRGSIQADDNIYAGRDLQAAERVTVDGVKEYRESFTANGNSTLTFDVDIKNIGGSGQPFEVFAGWTHYSTSFGCMFKAAYYQRSTVQSDITLVQTLINQSSLNGGFWSVSYVDANTIRITKNAGSHTSSGHGYIRVTHL